MKEIKNEIRELASRYRKELNLRIEERVKEMEHDDNSHFLIYKVLGIPSCEGKDIDIYQNKGRFLYKYAGSFLEEATLLCFKYAFKDAKSKVMIENTSGKRPKNFEIDCLIDDKAYEIKWRDATTDGDHITKEHTRIKVINEKGYKPIRIMFYYPNRSQSIKIQKTLETLYKSLNGEYYYGDSAWKYIKDTTKIDLEKILNELADEVTNERVN